MRPESSQARLLVGVIGLGSMGMGVARSLLRAGPLVSGYDIRPDTRRQFEELGGVAASCPSEAGRRTRAVVIPVVNAEQTEEVIFGAGGLGKSMEPGLVTVTSSALPPVSAADLGHRVRKGA
jgi:3-hydroxyisobutyrate dehydrogenase